MLLLYINFISELIALIFKFITCLLGNNITNHQNISQILIVTTTIVTNILFISTQQASVVCSFLTILTVKAIIWCRYLRNGTGKIREV